MRIIIIGAGRIGRSLAKSLTGENHKVFLIEVNEEKASRVDEKLDVKVVIGNGADPDILKGVGIEQADLVLAVTTSDETNLVVCALSGALGAKRRIARVRSKALSDVLNEVGYNQFQINEIINPDLVAARSIVKAIETPGTKEVADFAEGRILLRVFEVPSSSPLCGLKISEFKDEDFPWPFLIVAIIRNGSVLIPGGDTSIQSSDRIYVLLPAPSLGEFLTFVDPAIRRPKKAVIYGATFTGEHVAKSLAKNIPEIILLEENTELAEDIAERLENVRVINGSGSEADILREAGVEAADVFIATSKNDPSNLISSVLAKKMGVKTTIITTQQPDYMAIMDALDVDVIINPHVLAVEQILHLVRGKGISSVAKLLECETEVLEFVTEAGAPVTKAPIKDLKFPKNSIVGAVYQGAEIVLAKGDTQIKEGDKVIVFCQEAAVKQLQKLFTCKKSLIG